jgi:hypothetical protein
MPCNACHAVLLEFEQNIRLRSAWCTAWAPKFTDLNTHFFVGPRAVRNVSEKNVCFSDISFSEIFSVLLECVYGDRYCETNGFILGAFPKLQKAIINLVVSVRPHGTTRTSLDRFFETLYLSIFFFENMSKKSKFDWNLTIVTGTLLEDLCKFMVIFLWIMFRMRNGLDKSCTENQTTDFMFNNFFYENRVVYEIMSKNMADAEGLQMTI